MPIQKKEREEALAPNILLRNNNVLNAFLNKLLRYFTT